MYFNTYLKIRKRIIQKRMKNYNPEKTIEEYISNLENEFNVKIKIKNDYPWVYITHINDVFIEDCTKDDWGWLIAVAQMTEEVEYKIVNENITKEMISFKILI